MNNQELIEEVDKGWVLSEDALRLVKQDYDTIPMHVHFAVKLKTGAYTILKKTEKFDDTVLEKLESYENALHLLQRLRNEHD